MVSRPTFSARIANAPVWFSVPPITLSPTPLLAGIDSPVTNDSSSALRPSTTRRRRHLLARPHAQGVADAYRVERNVLLATVGADAACGLRREVEQRADRAASLRPGAQLQHLAEQRQHGDDGGRLEIDSDRPVRIAEGRRKQRTREFRGRYHVLGGAISPIDGIGPDDLKITELVRRLGQEPIEEVILATNPNLNGEATATYLSRLLRTMGLRVTRLASGLPVGGDLEYADEVTLGRAFEGRRVVDA